MTIFVSVVCATCSGADGRGTEFKHSIWLQDALAASSMYSGVKPYYQRTILWFSDVSWPPMCLFKGPFCFFLAGAWKGAKELGYLKPLHNKELRRYPQVSKHILVFELGHVICFQLPWVKPWKCKILGAPGEVHPNVTSIPNLGHLEGANVVIHSRYCWWKKS